MTPPTCPRPTPRGASRRRPDGGAGLIGATAGLVVVVAFLLFAVHLLVRLHAASLVGSAATAGAREVATAGIDTTDPAAVAAATGRADASVRDLLGEAGRTAELDWSGTTAEEVVLRVRLEVPDVLPASAGVELPFDVVERTARVRVEAAR